MFFLIIVIAIIVIGVLNFGGQVAATYNLKQENKASMDRAQRNYEDWAKKTAGDLDAYYSPVSRSINTNYWSDGSLKVDPHTKKQYGKGEFMCDSKGTMTDWRQAGPNVKRPPSN